MRVLVAAGFESDSPYAHAINSVKMAQGFARAGCDTTLMCRRGDRGKVTFEQFADHFALTEKFSLVQLPRRSGDAGRFSLCALPWLLAHHPDLIYARNYLFPCATTRLGIPTVAESHAHPGSTSRPLASMLKCTVRDSFRTLITISNHLADNFVALGVPRDKIAVLPDAVDLEQFIRPDSPTVAPFKADNPVVVYAGHLYDYKGIPTALEAAALLTDVAFHFVGGVEDDVNRQRARATQMGLKNVTFHGHLAQSALPPFLWHADALLLPPSANHPSAKWTSPLKLGEYLASGTPVVASAIPALKDWLSSDECVFFEPDNPKALATAIKRVLSDRELSAALSARGLEMARDLSYTSRAEKILDRALGSQARKKG